MLTAVVAIAFYVFHRLASTDEILHNKVDVIAEVHTQAIAYPLWTLNQDGLARSIRTLALYPEISCVEVFELSLNQSFQSPENCSSDNKVETVYKRELVYENVAVGQLNIFYTSDPLTKALKREIYISALFSLLLVTVVSVAAYAAMQLIVARPLQQLIMAIKKSEKQDQRLPVKWSYRDELGGVMTAYNDMIRQVDDKTAELVAAREQAVSAAQTKSRFLANMSHELRTPLNAVIGIAEMLREEAEEAELDTEPYERITGSGRHLLNLIDGVLDFSKIEAGKVEISLEQVNLYELIEDVSATVQSLADDNKNQLTLNYHGQPEFLLTDPLRLSQILLNLLSNACKFTKRGHIQLNVTETGFPPDGGVMFSVEDNGIGIAPDRRKRLFREFSQVDSSTTRKYGGTGLGLAISQRLCFLLGGEITVTSEFGEGSVFSFILPTYTVANTDV
ncbi:MAG: sensor histidine kinase [Granulosicoccus sp.]